MRTNYLDREHPVSVIAHDAAEALKGVIENIEDHLLNNTDLTREKISSSACALRYIVELLGNMGDRAEALERREL